MDNNHNLELEYKYYRENLDNLLEKYNNKFIVIKGQSIIGFYDSMDEAISETIKEHKLGTFIVQHCISNVEEQSFFSRVSFV